MNRWILVLLAVPLLGFGFVTSCKKEDPPPSKVELGEGTSNLLKAADNAVFQLDIQIERATVSVEAQENLLLIRSQLESKLLANDIRIIVNEWQLLNDIWSGSLAGKQTTEQDTDSDTFPGSDEFAQGSFKTSIQFETVMDKLKNIEYFETLATGDGSGIIMVPGITSFFSATSVNVDPAPCDHSCLSWLYSNVCDDMGLSALWGAMPVVGSGAELFLTTGASGNLLGRCVQWNSDECTVIELLDRLVGLGSSALHKDDKLGLGTTLKMMALIKTAGAVSVDGAAYTKACLEEQASACQSFPDDTTGRPVDTQVDDTGSDSPDTTETTPPDTGSESESESQLDTGSETQSTDTGSETVPPDTGSDFIDTDTQSETSTSTDTSG